MNSGYFKIKHETCGVSKVKHSCSSMESLILDSRVGVSRMSIAQEFLFSRDASTESSPLLKTMFGWLEGHVLSSSEGDNRTNGVTNFTSPNRSLLGWCSVIGISKWVAKAVSPNFSFRLPWEGFSWKRLSKGWPTRSSNSRMAKIWKSMWTSFLSISMGTALAIPQHSKISPEGLLKSLLVETSGMLPKRFFC